jgi:hypothetical protein
LGLVTCLRHIKKRYSITLDLAGFVLFTLPNFTEGDSMFLLLMQLLQTVERLEQIERRQEGVHQRLEGEKARDALLHETRDAVHVLKEIAVHASADSLSQGYSTLPESVRSAIERFLTVLRNEFSDAHSHLQTVDKVTSYVEGHYAVEFRHQQRARTVSSNESALRRVRSAYEILKIVLRVYLDDRNTEMLQRKVIQEIMIKIEYCIENFGRRSL